MMKLPLVLLLLGPALAASAGTFDDRDAQALEPGQYGNSAPDTAHSTAGAAAPSRDAAPAGNPSLANSAGGAAAPNRDAAALAGNPSLANSAGGAAAPNRDAVAPAGNSSWANSTGGAATTDRDTAAPAGNPLWAIPLNALTATRDRPLFSASRRPPPLAVGTVAPPPSRPAPAAPAPPERPPLTLMGTIIGAEFEHRAGEQFQHAGGFATASGRGELRLAGARGRPALNRRRKGGAIGNPRPAQAG